MSEFHVRIVRVKDVKKHPNADTLSIATVNNGYPVIFRTGDFAESDFAIYVPVDAVIHPSVPRTEFLGEQRRIKAKRLRGIFSMGLLLPLQTLWDLHPFDHLDFWGDLDGTIITDLVSEITKYEPPEPASMGGEDERDPGFLPTYSDIEGLRAFPNVLIPGEEVVLTEKIHGANARWLYRDGRMWAGSHHRIKSESAGSLYWRAAKQYMIEERLRSRGFTNLALYGEVYGNVQSLKYGAKKGEISVALFDAMDTTTNTYLSYDAFVDVATKLNLPVVPELYRGPWSSDLVKLAEGNSTLAAHVREGFVIRPVVERVDFTVPGQRVIFKMIGEGYMLS